MTRRSTALLGLGLGALLSACGGDGAAVDGCEEVVAPDAWTGGDAPRFVELWRAGGTNEGEELARPLSAAVGPRGRLAILDAQLGPIGVGPDGEWFGPLAAPGPGPGEVGAAFAAAWSEEGHLALFDVGQLRTLLLDVSGVTADEDVGSTRPLEASPIDPNAFAAIGAGVGGLGLTPGRIAYAVPIRPRPEAAELEQTVVRLAAGGTVDTLASAVTSALVADWPPARQIAAPGAARLLLAVGVDGRVAIAGEESSYRIRILRPGAEDLEICRTVTGGELRPDERGVGLDETNPFAEFLPDTAAPEEPFPMGRLLFARDGRLWVERDRPGLDPIQFLLGRPGSRYDVFERDGGYLGELRAPPGARIVAISGDRVWAFETGDFDETRVVAYRLER